MKNHMKGLTSIVGQHKFTVGVAALALIAGTANVARADIIGYPNVGTLNPATYTFTATSSGNITAYYSGSSAGYISQIGLLVNGVATGITGLQNNTATIGQSLVLGSVNAGDVLTFELIVRSPDNLTAVGTLYSTPSMNAPYDIAGGNTVVGAQHIYSTAYSDTSPIPNPAGGTIPTGIIPAGTYVAFEDIYIPGNTTTFPDYDYNDETFIFTDVTTTNNVPDSASSLMLLGIAFTGIGLLRRRFSA